MDDPEPLYPPVLFHQFNPRTPDSSVGKESAYNAWDPGWIPRLRRSTGKGIGYPLQYSWSSFVAQLVKSHLQCGRPGFDPQVGKTPWRRERLPTPVFWPGEFHGIQSTGSQGVRHNWVTFISLTAFVSMGLSSASLPYGLPWWLRG